MTIETRIIFEAINKETGAVIARDAIMTLDITRPDSIDDIGLTAANQHQLVQHTADKIIELQGPMINVYDTCPRCKEKISKRGKTTCEVHSLTTDHIVDLQKYRCSHCNWTSSDSIRNIYGSDTHTSLTKLQAELGCSYSYRKVASILQLLSSYIKRPVNNKERVKRVLTEVGTIIDAYHEEEIQVKDIKDEASHLIINVDGGHVATQEKAHRSFEVMIGTIYKPEDVKVVTENENIITNKTCVASAKEDHQASIKIKIVNAAKRAGMTKKTKVTGFSDGAANCKSVIRALKEHCGEFESILDWFHISMKFQGIAPLLPEDVKQELTSAKWKLWHGLPHECIDKLDVLSTKIEDEKLKDRIIRLKNYLVNNVEILVNYDERKNKNLPFTSQVAESTVENLVNSRCRQTKKMQWLREGTHTLLQVKCAHYCNSFNKIWEYVMPKLTQKIA
jgi:transposase-like protein/translation initiation factor 1 (eIF-1/SUI1)